MGLRETKSAQRTVSPVSSRTPRSPQYLRIFAVRSPKREIFPGVKWRRRKLWQPTLFRSKLLISLGSNSGGVRIPYRHPTEIERKRRLWVGFESRAGIQLVT